MIFTVKAVKERSAEVLKDWQRKTKYELETKDCLIQDMEK